MERRADFAGWWHAGRLRGQQACGGGDDRKPAIFAEGGWFGVFAALDAGDSVLFDEKFADGISGRHYD